MSETLEVQRAFKVEKVVKSKPTILPEKMGLAESKRHDWVVDIDPSRSIDEIIDPEFWAHVAAQFDPLDTIEARWEDGSRIVHIRVRYCERTYAKVKVTSVEELGDVISEIPASSRKHRVEWKGPVLRFAVIRNSDSMVLQSGFKERSVADSWLIEHEKA